MVQLLDQAQAMSVLDSAPLAILVLDEQQRFIWANGNLDEILGLKKEQLLGKTVADVDQLPLQSLMNASRRDVTLSLDTAEGLRWIKCWYQSFEQGGACYLMDITDHQQLRMAYEDLLKDMDAKNTRDNLTGLLNRRGLMQVLESQVSRSRRYENPLSLIRLDIADFQALDGGDRPDEADVLPSVGYLLNDQLRWADMAGRLDDNHFLLILPETANDAAIRLVGKISAQLKSYRLDSLGQNIEVKVMCGISSWSKGDDLGKLLRRAEEGVAQAVVLDNEQARMSS